MIMHARALGFCLQPTIISLRLAKPSASFSMTSLFSCVRGWFYAPPTPEELQRAAHSRDLEAIMLARQRDRLPWTLCAFPVCGAVKIGVHIVGVVLAKSNSDRHNPRAMYILPVKIVDVDSEYVLFDIVATPFVVEPMLENTVKNHYALSYPIREHERLAIPLAYAAPLPWAWYIYRMLHGGRAIANMACGFLVEEYLSAR